MTELNKSKHFDVYVDEAGNTSYYNDAQPVVLWAGVITDKKHSEFDEITKSLLKRFKLNEDVEIHASHLSGGSAPFNGLSERERDELYFEFIKIGIEFINYYHESHDLKPFRRVEERIKLEDRNLNPLLSQLHFFMTSLDFYFEYELKADYSIFFDSSSNFKKTTKRLILELLKPSGKYYCLKRLKSPPMQIESMNNRFIQLSDAIGYMIAKQAQLVKTFEGRERVLKDKSFIEKCYNTIEPKKIPFVKAIVAEFEEYEKWDDDRIETKDRLCDSWKNRDFKHMGKKWLPKKNKPDIFRHDVNTFWKEKNDEILQWRNEIKKNFGPLSSLNSKQTDKRSRQSFGNIVIEVFSQIKEVLIDKYRRYSDLPEMKALISDFDAYVEMAAENYEVNPNATTPDANEIAESILRQKKFIPDSDRIIIDRLVDKRIINLLIPIYASIKTINENLNKCGTTQDEIKKFMENSLTKYSNIVQKCILSLGDLLEHEVPSIKISDDALRFNLSYQRRYMKKLLEEIINVLYSTGIKLDSFRRLLTMWFGFSDKNLSKIVNILIQRQDNLKRIMDELILNLKDYIALIG